MDELWKLIEDEAQAIAGYYDFIAKDSMKTTEMEPVVATVQRIVSDERDHLKALLILYDSMTKNKPATDMSDFARQAIVDYRESLKKIK